MRRRQTLLVLGLVLAALWLPAGLMGQAKEATATLAITGMT